MDNNHQLIKSRNPRRLQSTILASSMLALTVLLPVFASAQPSIYYSDYVRAGIYRADLDGANETLLLSTSNPEGVALDQVHQRLYWIDSLTGLMRSSLDGSSSEVLIAVSGLTQLRLDVKNGYIYFLKGAAGEFHRADLAGQNDSLLFVDPSTDTRVSDFDIDIKHNKIYWTKSALPEVWQATLNDGSGAAAIVNHASQGAIGYPAIAYSANPRILYYSTGASVRKVNVNGTSDREVFLNSADVLSLLPDPVGSNLYYSFVNSPLSHAILKFLKNGQRKIIALVSANSLAVDPRKRALTKNTVLSLPPGLARVGEGAVSVHMEQFAKVIAKGHKTSSLQAIYRISTQRIKDGDNNLVDEKSRTITSKKSSLTAKFKERGTFRIRYEVLGAVKQGSGYKVLFRTAIGPSQEIDLPLSLH